MSCYVFRAGDRGGWEILFFDGTHLRPVPLPPDYTDEQIRSCSWGRSARGALVTATMLVRHTGLPEDLVPDVAELLAAEWVTHMPRGSQTVPEWVVRQECCRLAVRVMSAAYNGGQEDNGRV